MRRMLLEVENAHAATCYAAWAVDADAPDVVVATSSGKAYVSDASRKVCGSSIQVHGGIGFTWDYDLHLYAKRAKHFEPLYGDADWHRKRALRARVFHSYGYGYTLLEQPHPVRRLVASQRITAEELVRVFPRTLGANLKPAQGTGFCTLLD
ncbi:MAG: hypothetical protein NVSMB2_09900 [Chloroflexota bacterium]